MPCWAGGGGILAHPGTSARAAGGPVGPAARDGGGNGAAVRGPHASEGEGV
jgi:hypothetical protein